MRKFNLNKRNILIILLAFMFLLISCSRPQGGDNGGDNNNPGGGKETEVTYSEHFLYKDGASSYTIVLPENAETVTETAGNELRELFALATGINLPIVRDTDKVFDENASVISLGDTTIFQGSGVTADYSSLGPDGFIIHTLGKTVVLNGAGVNGKMFSVYGFLEQNLGYRFYAKDEIRFSNKSEQKLVEFDNYTEVPDFMGRWVDSYTLYSDYKYTARLKNTGNMSKTPYYESHWSYLNDQSMASQILPPSRYMKDHPDWYYGDGLSGGGVNITKVYYDEEAYNTFVDNLYQFFIDEPNAVFFMLGINDNPYYATDTASVKEMNKYKHSGMMVRLCNKVAESIQERLEEDDNPDREFYIVMFAYLYDLPSPTIDDGKGGYKLIDESVKAHKNVMVRIAPIESGNMYLHSDFEKNPHAASAFASWSIVTDNIAVWDYGLNIRAYIAPYPDWYTLKGNMLMYKELGVQDILTQVPHVTSGTPFYALVLYVRSRLMWDLNLDVYALIEDFMDMYYGEAAAEIYEYFNYINLLYENSAKKGLYTGTIGSRTPLTSAIWSFENVREMERIFEKAYLAIEPLKTTDTARYNKLLNRINTESLFYRFLQIEVYGNDFKNTISKKIDTFERLAAEGNLLSIDREGYAGSLGTGYVYYVVNRWRNTY